MRLSDFRDYFVLRRHLVHPWRFLRLRKRGIGGDHEDIPFRDGFSVRLRGVPMDRHILHHIFARDEYRLGDVRKKEWDTVIDLGAHIGLFAVRVSPLAKRVLSYEPVADNFRMLERNTKAFDNVTAVRKAVGARRGTVKMHLSDNPSAHSIYSGSYASGRETEAECVTLEDVIRGHGVERCDFLKLDCEGAEYGILESLPDDLWSGIRRIAMEYHPVPEETGWTGERLEAHLEAKGFDVERIPHRRKKGKGNLYARRRTSE